MERRLLREKEVRPVERQVPVDLVRRDLMEPVDAVLAAGIEQDARADDIRLQEDFRILDRAVDVALRRKVDDDVRLFRLEDPVNGPTVGDVRADELELILFQRRRERLEVPRIRELVKADDLVFRMLLELVVDEIAADKAGSARHDDIHR